ncbi:MAG: HAD hydrolase-like protein [Spirochaetes bacterium]|nr:HAD hydrolase-like protein [Spirochaetota bacterium]
MKKLLIYDFDGVLVNSNFLKKNTIKNVCLKYFKGSDDLLDELMLKDGWTRYSLISEMVKIFNKELSYKEKILGEINDKLDQDMLFVEKVVLPSKKLKDTYQVIVSASCDKSINKLVSTYQWSYFFDKIYGSPRTKMQIITDEINLKLYNEIILIGDSISDYNIAQKIQAEFIGIYSWSSEPEKINNLETKKYISLQKYFDKTYEK